MNIKEKLVSLKGNNNLTDYVIDYYLDEDDIKSSMEDLMNYGCQSGVVGPLIYYADTVEFCDKYKEEINELASELVEGCGVNSIFDLIQKLDREDQLIIDDYNKNTMAWFGFEETVNNLYREVFENDYEVDFV